MRRLFLLAAAVFVVLSASLHAQEDSKKEQLPSSVRVTRIEGKSIDDWVRLINSRDPSLAEHAIQTVAKFGPERGYQGVPSIINLLYKHTNSYPLDTGVRASGILTLGTILGGTESDPKYIKKTVLLLIRSLQDREDIVRLRAAEALGQIGPEARSAIPQLLYTLKDRYSWQTRAAAAAALGRIASDNSDKKGASTTVLSALYDRLRDRSSQVRLAAIQALTWMGGPANPYQQAAMVKALLPVTQKDPNGMIRIWAHMAIMSIHHKVTDEYVTPIAKMLREEKEVSVRVQAAKAIGTMGPKAKIAIPALIKALKDEEPEVIGWSAWALSRMEIWGKTAYPALEQVASNNGHPKLIRTVAENALLKLQGKDMKEDKK